MAAKVRVWLDDVRPAPEGWVWTKTVQETRERIERGDVAEVSLDYDLDLTDPNHKGSEIAAWLRRQAMRGVEIPVVHVHTANPHGGALMAQMRQASEGETGKWARQWEAALQRVRRRVMR